MNTSRRTFIKTAGMGIMTSLVGGCASSVRRSQRKPNFVVIFTDDQGYQDLGCFGSPNIKTPNIDKMADEGMRFTDFYVGASVCTPSRAGLLTGCYPGRVGNLPVLFPNGKRGLNPNEVTIARMLKGQGYASACIGKWHLGHKPEFLPTRHGFDTYYGIPYSNDMWIDPEMKLAKEIKLREGMTLADIAGHSEKKKIKRNLVPLMRDEEVIEYPADQRTLTQRYTAEAIKFITQNRDNPFFLYLPHTMPHIPLYASDAFRGKSEIGLYGDTIQEIDHSTGEILRCLKSLGLDENTMVVYTSDNGPWNLKDMQQHKQKGDMHRRVGGSALPLKGWKFSKHEGGYRVPAVMRWPGKIPAGVTCGEIVSTIDLLPTLAGYSGASLPKNKIDGKSIAPLIENRPGARSPHDYFLYSGNNEALIRQDKWKYYEDKLYDLSTDISEKHDVAGEHPEVAQKLAALAKEKVTEIKEQMRPAGELL